jgi:hypothetical protein
MNHALAITGSQGQLLGREFVKGLDFLPKLYQVFFLQYSVTIYRVSLMDKAYLRRKIIKAHSIKKKSEINLFTANTALQNHHISHCLFWESQLRG